MSRIPVILGAAAIAAGLVLGVAPPASAVNGPECDQTTQGAWWDSSTEVVEADIGDSMPAGLSPWRDRVTCSWISEKGFVSDGHPAYSMVFRDFPTSEMPTLYRALITSGWNMAPPSINVAGTALPVEDRDSFTSVPDDVVFVDSDGTTPDGSGWVSFRYDTTDGWYERGWDEPSLVVAWWGVRPQTATGIFDPSTFSTLRTVSEAMPTPTQTAVIAGSAVFLMLVVGWPGYLLDGVIGARFDDVRDWARSRTTRPRTRLAALTERVRGWLRTPAPAPAIESTDAAASVTPESPAAPAPVAAPAVESMTPAGTTSRRAPAWLIWPGLALAAFISCFVDPSFGLNFMSLRLLVSALIAFVAFNFGVLTLTRLVLRRLQPGAPPRLEFRWASLGLVLVAVVLARLLSFNPGIVFGLVAGLVFAVSLTQARSAAVTLVGVGFGLVAGGLAWVAYSVLVTLAAGAPGVLVLSETFAGITLEGISALPLALLPLAALEGQKLFAWNRWVWAGAYSVALAAFMLVLVAVPDSFGEIQGDFVLWVVIFVVFGLVAIGAWGLNAWFERRQAAASGGGGDTDVGKDAAPSPGVG